MPWPLPGVVPNGTGLAPKRHSSRRCLLRRLGRSDRVVVKDGADRRHHSRAGHALLARESAGAPARGAPWSKVRSAQDDRRGHGGPTAADPSRRSGRRRGLATRRRIGGPFGSNSQNSGAVGSGDAGSGGLKAPHSARWVRQAPLPVNLYPHGHAAAQTSGLRRLPPPAARADCGEPHRSVRLAGRPPSARPVRRALAGPGQMTRRV